jgi:hypothetical protein
MSCLLSEEVSATTQMLADNCAQPVSLLPRGYFLDGSALNRHTHRTIHSRIGGIVGLEEQPFPVRCKSSFHCEMLLPGYDWFRRSPRHRLAIDAP